MWVRDDEPQLLFALVHQQHRRRRGVDHACRDVHDKLQEPRVAAAVR
jgi:hypothetical protein